ncbi:uncharacterized protein LOC132057588 [Lycium ferocissimum]|uniref:uncharacterized protein LOC132057588 n=1 Tax=Lycium ferocissimum TaxID=112874 RepID=UPI0028160B25|nr:uncharacterized protein LOC132057588 [Lycium ferocissimum]
MDRFPQCDQLHYGTGYNYGFPEVLFLVEPPLPHYHDLYEYDYETKRYKIPAALDKVSPINYPLYTFVPTLARVHKTLADKVHPKHVSSITATLVSKQLHKISINPPNPITHCEITLPVNVSILASCKGLLLIYFDKVGFCVFNPITGAYRLISDPESTNNSLMIGKAGVWREFQYRMNLSNNSTFRHFSVYNRAVYVNGSLHWLRIDGSVVAFDTKREHTKIINPPEFISRCVHGNINPVYYRVTQGLLTLICLFKNSIVVAAYDYESSSWRVSHASPPNFTKNPHWLNYNNYGFTIWIDSKRVLFQDDGRRFNLYEYDSEINGYKIAAVLDIDYKISLFLCSFEPTLASVHTTLSVPVDAKHLSAITATLDDIKRFMADNTSY